MMLIMEWRSNDPYWAMIAILFWTEFYNSSYSAHMTSCISDSEALINLTNRRDRMILRYKRMNY